MENRIVLLKKTWYTKQAVACIYKYSFERSFSHFNLSWEVQWNIDISSKDEIITEKYYSPINGVIYTTDDIIQNKPLSIPSTTNMLDMDVTVYDKHQLFSTPRKTTKAPLHQNLKNICFTSFHLDLIKYNINNTRQRILKVRKVLHQ